VPVFQDDGMSVIYGTINCELQLQNFRFISIVMKTFIFIVVLFYKFMFLLFICPVPAMACVIYNTHGTGI